MTDDRRKASRSAFENRADRRVVLRPGDKLRIIKRTVGLGAETLDAHSLPVGEFVEYVKPAWIKVRLDTGELVDVPVDCVSRV